MADEIVIVPTYQRSEFLYCALECIRAAEPAIPVHVWPDRGTDELAVCEKFGAVHHWTWQHTYHGNSANLCEAMKWAHSQNASLVYVIEDDCLVEPDFFSWCRAALRSHPEAFAACGWKYSPDALEGDGPDMLMAWYLSVAAALPRRSLAAIVQHARPEYYANMRRYLDRAYPASFRRGSEHHEQDGLVLRVCESESRRCVWPRRPRARHIGWSGYHMSGKPFAGTLEERVGLIKLALANPTVLARLMSGGAVPEVQKCGECGKLVLSEERGVRIICVGCWHTRYPDLPVCSASHYYLPPAFRD